MVFISNMVYRLLIQGPRHVYAAASGLREFEIVLTLPHAGLEQGPRIYASFGRQRFQKMSRHCQKTIFLHFFVVLRVRDQSQSLLQASKLNFLLKVYDLEAYLPSYVTFRHFCRVWEVATSFFLDFDLEFFEFLLFCTRTPGCPPHPTHF